ncbi:opine metallophore biosynthesis dehydrogenase, partial [Staphylococcus saprophyticus]
MACTADAYRSILNRLAKATVECLQHIVLVSPTLGSHMVIEQLLSELNLDVEVVSFSTYLGDTRVVDTTQPHQVLTSGVKSKLYVGSTHTDSRFIDRICVL